MSKNRLDNSVPVRLTPDGRAFTIYGRAFAFDSADKTGKSKAAASMDAERWGQQIQSALAQRLGRPLSTREQISGKPDPVPAPKLEGSLRPVDTGPKNPYLTRAAEVEARWRTTTPDLKARKIKRLEELAEAARQWDAKHAGDVSADARRTNPTYIKALQHAQDRAEEYRLRTDLDQATVDNALESVKALESGAITAEQYIASLEPVPQPEHSGDLYSRDAAGRFAGA